MSRSLAAGGVIALAIACGLVLSQHPSQSVPLDTQNTALEWLADPRPIAKFTLSSGAGDVTNDSLKGHWHFLVLGFTHCPDLCPTTLTELARLRTTLADERARVLFVSVDPDRDSPARLAGYVEFFGTGITGITGEKPQLKRLANSLGMDFRHDGATTFPRISHSPTIALIGPDGYLRGRLRPGFDVQKAAREIILQLRAAS
ncbi:Uncharacterised protein [Halioglobus japonicus]|nr:Uncharacterised protein [Halioglobus japonicus]